MADKYVIPDFLKDNLDFFGKIVSTCGAQYEVVGDGKRIVTLQATHGQMRIIVLAKKSLRPHIR